MLSVRLSLLNTLHPLADPGAKRTYTKLQVDCTKDQLKGRTFSNNDELVRIKSMRGDLRNE